MGDCIRIRLSAFDKTVMMKVWRHGSGCWAPTKDGIGAGLSSNVNAVMLIPKI